MENQKKTLRDNIYLLSNTVDFSDQNFSGNAESGTSRKYRFSALEDRCIKKERKFTKAFYEQYNLFFCKLDVTPEFSDSQTFFCVPLG